MTPKRILVIQGHPDSTTAHLCHALAASYTQAAIQAGHEVKHCDIAGLDFPLLRSQKDFDTGLLPASLQVAQNSIFWCNHLVLFFPLWAGDMPALVYRWYFRAHSVKSLERNLFGMVGIGPVSETLVGLAADMEVAQTAQWLKKLASLGARGA